MAVSTARDLHGLVEGLARVLHLVSWKASPPDVRRAIQWALGAESSPSARAVPHTMLRAISVGGGRGVLVCHHPAIPTRATRRLKSSG